MVCSVRRICSFLSQDGLSLSDVKQSVRRSICLCICDHSLCPLKTILLIRSRSHGIPTWEVAVPPVEQTVPGKSWWAQRPLSPLLQSELRKFSAVKTLSSMIGLFRHVPSLFMWTADLLQCSLSWGLALVSLPVYKLFINTEGSLCGLFEYLLMPLPCLSCL